jgi:hypothetical protein
MKQVTHGIDEDDARLAPVSRETYKVPMKCKVKSIYVLSVASGLKAISHHGGIAVFATRTDFRASSERIPRGLSPRNSRIVVHVLVSFHRPDESMRGI